MLGTNLKFFISRNLEETYNALAGLMSDYWVNFVKTGNPNGPGLPEWPRYNTTDNLAEVFDTIIQTEIIPGKCGLDFMLSKYGYFSGPGSFNPLR